MIVGPTGCGKSTLLAQIQRNFILTNRNIFGLSKPSVFISLRNIGKIENTEALDTDINGREALRNAANKVCSAIGYPLHPPFISRFFDSVEKLKVGDTEVSVRSSYVLQEKIQEALSILFESMADSGGLVIVDEVLDLLRDDRLKKSGGDRIFNHLATLIVSYMVNFSQVKGAFAGSSNFLNEEFDKTVACDFRWHKEYISDLPETYLLDYFTKTNGLELSVAESIVKSCGTRFRIINDAMLSSSTDDNIEENITNLYKETAKQLETFLQLDDKYEIPKILEYMLDKKEKKMHLSDLHENLQRQERISKFFYVGPGSELYFENKIIKNLVRLKFSSK